MELKTLLAIILSLIVFSLTTVLSICGSKSGSSAPVNVAVYTNQISAISPAEFSVQVSIYSPSPIKLVKIFLDNDLLLEREIRKEEKSQDTNFLENEFSFTITSGGRYVNISFSKTITFSGGVAKIFSFRALAETEEKAQGVAKSDVIVYSNQPCSVRVYIASPQGVPIELPPYTVQIGAEVTDDRCGTFNHFTGTECKFRFIWDADNRGGEFSEDATTDQPFLTFTYQNIGIYTPKVRVIDDGGNTCESTNVEPVYVLRRFEKIIPYQKGIFPSFVEAKFINPITKILVSNSDYGIIEYDVGQDGRFVFRNMVSQTAPMVKIGENFVFVGSGANVKIYPLSSSSVNWNSSYEITRLFEKLDFVSFQNRATFLVFFRGDNVFFCPFKPPEFIGDTGCSLSQIGRSGAYRLYADEENLKIYLAMYKEGTNFKISVFSFNITYESSQDIWIVNGANFTRFEESIDYLPSKFVFFKEGGRIYLLITTTDSSGLVGYRTYIFDVLSCFSGVCEPLENTNITMPEVIRDIPGDEICPLAEQKKYLLNIFDISVADEISLCGSGNICLLSSLCLDEENGTKCRKVALYPFLFSSGTIKRNLLTNCMINEVGSKKILFADFDRVIMQSGTIIFSGKISKNKLEITDSETLNIEPQNLSGFQTDDGIFLSIGGKWGIDVAKFSNDGVFKNYVFHLYVKPDPKDVPGYPYDLITNPEYSVINHFYDGKALIALLQRGGCGEDFNFSGIFVYDNDELKSRKYKIYKRYNDIGIHSVSVSEIKKISDKYKINIVGVRCQEVRYHLISYDLENFALRESFRMELTEPVVDLFTHSDEIIYVSTTTSIIKIENGQIRRKVEGEGGGKIQTYRGYLFEFVPQGAYITIKVFDGELNKIKEQPIYFGIYPEISKLVITEAIDEIFGTGQNIDIAILGLGTPAPEMRISAMVVFYLTDFIRSGKDIEILGISPNFKVTTSDVKFFRGSRNIIFLVDPLSREVLSSFLK